jgi:hypothetical protein
MSAFPRDTPQFPAIPRDCPAISAIPATPCKIACCKLPVANCLLPPQTTSPQVDLMCYFYTKIGLCKGIHSKSLVDKS